MRSVVMFTMLHEIAHALIHNLRLDPRDPRDHEERLADDFAFLLLSKPGNLPLVREVIAVARTEQVTATWNAYLAPYTRIDTGQSF